MNSYDKFNNTFIRTSELNIEQLRSLYKKYLFVIKGVSGDNSITKAPYDLQWKFLMFKNDKLDFTNKYHFLEETTEKKLDDYLLGVINGEPK